MTKRKQTFWRKTFGKKFTIADAILIGIILGYPSYIIFTGGFKEIVEDAVKFIWVGVIVAYVGSILLRRARR